MEKRTASKGAQVLERRIKSIKNGNKQEKEDLIRDYIPFIVKSVSKCIDAYLESMESDEFSIGLRAFDEALQRYEPDKGNFISYADLVISSRIKDYYKKENRNRSLPLSSFDTENGNILEGAFRSGDFTSEVDIKEQLKEFKMKLGEYNMTLEQLLEESPKHKDTRVKALRVAKLVSTDATLKNEFMSNKKLPFSQIRREMQISQKSIRRSNGFITAAVLILINDWPDLKNQLPEFDKEGGELIDK